MKTCTLSLRTKLILNFLIVFVIGGILSLSFGSGLIENTIISQAQVKVKHDLASAWMVFYEKLNDIREILLVLLHRVVCSSVKVTVGLVLIKMELQR